MKKFLIVLGVTSCLSTLGFGITEANATECASINYDCGNGNGFMGSACGETREELIDTLLEMIDINCGEA